MRVFVATGSSPQPTGTDATHRLHHGTPILHRSAVARHCAARTRRPRPPCLAPAPVARDRAALRPHNLRNFHSASWARVLWLSQYLCKNWIHGHVDPILKPPATALPRAVPVTRHRSASRPYPSSATALPRARIARQHAASRLYPSPATALPRARTHRPRPRCLAPAQPEELP